MTWRKIATFSLFGKDDILSSFARLGNPLSTGQNSNTTFSLASRTCSVLSGGQYRERHSLLESLPSHCCPLDNGKDNILSDMSNLEGIVQQTMAKATHFLADCRQEFCPLDNGLLKYNARASGAMICSCSFRGGPDMIEMDKVPVADAAREQWNQYLDSYFDWAETWERGLLQNRQIVEAWQSEHDAPYPVYRLTYAVAPAEWSLNGKPSGP